ncbi:NAD(P)H-binding protein [Nocardioides plantarum]|uniref:NAD(P)H-binding protein n=1 Tax=Nocardioides plantarum TaxID=29299 RepID=A0ABV5KFR8_9ACTN|nr:NAD(P)H-binding protein [Nocardioides plantarum]
MSATDAFEIRTTPTSGLRWLTGMAVAFTVLMAMLALACLVGLLTQDVGGADAFAAAVIGGVGAYGAAVGARSVRGLRAAAEPELLARLDGDGLHLREGIVVSDDPEQEVPDHLGWSTVPWGWVRAVSHTTLDLRAAKALGSDVPLEVLRFTLADDRLLDDAPFETTHLAAPARLLSLTPTQVRTVLVGEAGHTDFTAAVGWLAARQPHLAVLTGTTLPWWTRATPDAWPESPRVAVVGASGRLGRLVVELLAGREKAPPVAVARNEAARAGLERLGAEVRMVDLEQGPAAVADALRGCAAVIHLAPTSPAVVVEAARRAGVTRFLLVPGAWNGDELVALAATSGLAWTALRPTLLTDDLPTGEVLLGQDVAPGPVPRGDLAEVLVAAIRDEDAVGGAFQVAGAPAPPGITSD